MTFQNVKGLNYYDLPDTLDGWAVLKGKTLYLSFIRSKKEGKGNFRRFLDEVEPKYTIKVPTPSIRMHQILIKRGYEETKDWFKEANDWVDVMIKKHNGTTKT